MASVEPIRSHHFEALYEKFLRDDDSRITREHWQRLFVSFSASSDTENFGYMLLDGSNIVGMLGMIHSLREIEGRAERFCNLHSWFVDAAYRGYSMLLMRPILKLQNCTITDLTPTSAVQKISERLGFQPLDSNVRILLPWKKKSPQGNALTFSWNEQIDASKLNEPELKLHQEQLQIGFDCLLVSTGSSHCFVVCRRVDIHWRPYCYVLHLSNPALFATHHAPIRQQLLQQSGGRFVAVDNRLFRDERVPFSFKLPFRTAQIFRSNTVSQEQIDPLYTEVALLGLTTFPSIRSVATRIKQRITKRS